MDSMTMEMSANNKKCLMDKLKDEIYSSLPKANEINGGGDGGGGDGAVIPAAVTAAVGNSNAATVMGETKKDASTAGTANVTNTGERTLGKSKDDSTTVNALKQQKHRNITNISRSSYQYPTDGGSGAGDAPYLGPLGCAMGNAGKADNEDNTNNSNNNIGNTNNSAYNMSVLARFLPVQTLREMNFDNLNANTAVAGDGLTTPGLMPQGALTEQSRKQLFERQFRQVEMGCPAGYDCYSRKVFVGGLPPDIDETAIQKTFRLFGPHIVDWPHKNEMNSPYPPKGFVFLLFYDDTGVRRLIESCANENGHLYISVSSHTMKDKPAEVRPWRLADADYIQDMNMTLDPRKTVFIGGVPRPIKAYELAMIMERLFGRVCYAGIDTDPDMKYPKGAGRVTFFSHHSYVAAISARFVQLQHQHIDKRVEIKPYVLDDQQCDECKGKRCSFKYARFFCSNTTCLRYYCDTCWTLIHARPGREYHKPLIKEYGDRPRAVPYCWHFIEKN